MKKNGSNITKEFVPSNTFYCIKYTHDDNKFIPIYFLCLNKNKNISLGI